MTVHGLNARLVTDAPPGSDEWLKARLQGITATDIPKIIGVSRWGNARSVWEAKRGNDAGDAVGEPALWGTLLEPVVADEWARRTGCTLQATGVLAHPEHDWRRASPDRIVTSYLTKGAAPALLEIKTKNAFSSGEWDPDTGRLPEDVEAQVAWQLHVTGLDHAHVAVLLGGQRLVTVDVERDPEVEAFIVAKADEVWAHVLNGTPPPVAYDETALKVLDRLFPDRSGGAVVPAGRAEELLAGWEKASMRISELRAELKAAEAERTTVRAEMVDLLGGADTAWVEGRQDPAWTYTTQMRKGYTVAEKQVTKFTVNP